MPYETRTNPVHHPERADGGQLSGTDATSQCYEPPE